MVMKFDSEECFLSLTRRHVWERVDTDEASPNAVAMIESLPEGDWDLHVCFVCADERWVRHGC